MPDRLLLEGEAAERLGVSKGTIARWRLTGKLGYFRTSPVLVAESDIEAYTARLAAIKRAKDGPEVGSPEYEDEQYYKIVRRARFAVFKMRWRAEMRKRRKAEEAETAASAL